MKTKNKKPINEDVYAMLLERFGEPIKGTEPIVGISNEGPDGKKTYEDEPLELKWNDPGATEK